MNKNIKNIIIIVFILSFMLCIYINSYALFAINENNCLGWLNKDGTFAKNGWKLIDEDEDGIGYFYYFDENGNLKIDDITPDYKIVNIMGRKIDDNGKEITEVVSDYNEDGEFVENTYIEELVTEFKKQQDDSGSSSGFKSNGGIITSYKEEVGPTPADNIVIDNNGQAKTILGPNVVIREKKETAYDVTISKKMQEHILSGSNFTKKTNGTTYLKIKWKDCMAMKGNGSNIIFENPKNNFNRLKGRIATHKFSYTETTTICTLYIIDETNNETLYETSDFNYNGGISFDVLFKRKCNKIKFELEVTGKYTSRVCYLRDCEFLFNKEAYQEELYEDEVEEAYIANYGTQSNADYVDEEFDDGMGEKSIEGEDPSARYKRLYGKVLSSGHSEDDDTVYSAEELASLSEADYVDEYDEEGNKVISDKSDSYLGPAFDERLKKETAAIGPSGFSNIVPAHLDSVD